VPRIQADSIAEHVAQQEAAVFEAAIRLFCEHGYAQVTMGDIAADVGLARNSLYRYFPDKAHILLRWFRAELPRQTERSRALLAGDGPPVERIKRWADDQLDYAHQPEHRLIAALSDAVPNLDADTRAGARRNRRRAVRSPRPDPRRGRHRARHRSRRHHRSDRRARPQRSPTGGTPRP
jgi:AcrR family transcriptional regulator